MKKLLRFSLFPIILLCLFFNLSANGIYLNGLGSKAVAMGGAFVGLADDSSAVFWNPAGLFQIKRTSINFQMMAVFPQMTYDFVPAGISTEAETKPITVPMGSIIHRINKNFVWGIAAYPSSRLATKWDGEGLKKLTSPPGVYRWESFMGVYTVSTMFSYKLSDQWSFGAAFNLNLAVLQLHMPRIVQYSEDLAGSGYNLTFGLLHTPWKDLHIGLSLKLPYKIKLKGDALMPDAYKDFNIPINNLSSAERETTWPLWIGFGMAWDVSDKLTISGDVHFTTWGQLDTIPIRYQRRSWQYVRKGQNPDLASMAYAFDNDLKLNWKDVFQFRFGIEYFLTKSFAMRAGYYYDPTVSPDDTLNILLPQVTNDVYTFGLGFKSRMFIIDCSVEWANGKKRTCPPTGTMPGDYSVNMLYTNISLTLVLD